MAASWKSTKYTGIQVQRERGGERYRVRITYRDESGRRRELWRITTSLGDARLAHHELTARAQSIRKGRRSAARPMTFRALAEAFARDRLIALEYDADGVKRKGHYAPGLISVLRDHLRKFTEFFAETPLDRISPAMLERFREERMVTQVTLVHTRGPKRGTPLLSADGKPKSRPRSLSTVNRELSFLRVVFSYAVRDRKIDSNPFGRSTKLIQESGEARRDRVLGLEEEDRLLLAASDPRRAHLRPFLVALTDTGMRAGEARSLTWRQIDLDRGVITIDSLHTKTKRARRVPITGRLRLEFEKLRGDAKPADERVFKNVGDVKRSFRTACRVAGITGLTLHGLRHTAAARLAARLPEAETAGILGHASASTTRRYYINQLDERLDRAREALESYRTEERGRNDPAPNSTVN